MNICRSTIIISHTFKKQGEKLIESGLADHENENKN